MSNEVAVNGMTLEIVEGNPTPVEGIITIIGIPSLINKSGNKGAYLDGLQIIISTITSNSGGATTPDPIPVNTAINATILKCKEKGTLFLITGDETVILNAIPIIPGSPPVNYPVTFKIKITDANQTVWKVK